MRTLNKLALVCGLLTSLIVVGCSNDTTAPSTVPPVQNLVASTVTDVSVTLTWEYADASKADSFRISRNGTAIATVASSVKTYTDNGLTAQTQYVYKLTAVKGSDLSAESSYGVITSAPGSSQKRAILQGQVVNADRTLSKDTIYTVVGFYFVQPGSKLIIPAGTRIEGDFQTKGAIITVRGTSTRSSGQIIAQGTASEPVLFTSNKPEGQRARADWGGIVLNGLADINFPGKIGVGEGGTGSYGWGNVLAAPKNNDTSGTLRYVRIEYGGTKVTPDNEINGLTLNGVGNGTTLEYVQAHMIADDGFEFFGGTVNGRYLVSSGNDDDQFDMDNGYSGHLQFLFGIEDPNLGNRGFEVDNDANGSGNTPYTSATISNMTLVGAGRPKANDDPNDGMYLRRNCRLKIYNAIVTNFGRYGITIDGDSCKNNVLNGDLFVKNSIIKADSGTFFLTKGSSEQTNSVIATWNLQTAVDPGLAGINFDAPNPIPGAAAMVGALDPTTLDQWFVSANYIGAFSTTNWAQGWTNFKRN